MTVLRKTLPWLILLLVAALGRPAAAQYTIPPDANASFTTIWNVASGNYATAGNWVAGVGAPGSAGVPDWNVNDFGLINNGGTAPVSTSVPQQAGGLILGTEAGNTGTLDIQAGGTLNVIEDPPATFTADGSMQVGRNGVGSLFVRRGGTLNSVSLSLGGQVGSTLTLGGTSGTGNATVNTRAVTLGRTTRVIGPNVAFNPTGTGAGITFQGTSVFIPEITGATHSALKTTGNATLAGTLQVDLNGATTTSGNTWTLLDAAAISGSFASIFGDPPVSLARRRGVRFRGG